MTATQYGEMLSRIPATFLNTNFGINTPEEMIYVGLKNAARGYVNGSTLRQCLIELKLTNKPARPYDPPIMTDLGFETLRNFILKGIGT